MSAKNVLSPAYPPKFFRGVRFGTWPAGLSSKLTEAFHLWHGAVAFVAAFIAGVINSIAGGGTLVSFPALIWLGLDSRFANATRTVAIWPASVGGLWGY